MKAFAIAALAAAGLASGLTAQTATRPQAAPADTFTMALTGDSIITRRLSPYQEPQFLKMIDIIRGADVAFTNLEMLFHDYETYAMQQSGGTYMRAEPALAKELVWAGFDLVSRANNHTGDYAPDAMRLTTRYVEAAGLVGAGVGETLSEAREPRFVETAKARVALVSCASTFPEHSRAGESRGSIPGRPGLSPLRFSTTYVTTAEGLVKLREGLQAAGIGGGGRGGGATPPQSLTVFGQRVEVGDTPGVRTTPNAEDLKEIATAVRSASKLADYTIATIHAHEGGRGGRLIPAEFLVTFARAMIDAGADVFVGHGPHVLRGIEIYKGKPILYSLGDFIFQNETLLRLPDENYATFDLGPDARVSDFNDRRYSNDTRGFPADPLIWESVVAVPRFKGKDLVDLTLHPITLGFGLPAARRGRPMLADEKLGRKIIDDLIKLSQPMGTTVEYRNGVGIVMR